MDLFVLQLEQLQESRCLFLFSFLPSFIVRSLFDIFSRRASKDLHEGPTKKSGVFGGVMVSSERPAISELK